MTADVRDMTCAQALAVVARAVAQLIEGQGLEILYNAQDVKHDLMIWAKERGLQQREDGPGWLRWQR
ncbi:MAG: sulfurtransferase TusA family protein [Candidatus Omnitrophica bacterium]|nr:sulfurtransferase TusA family protein [Candidatus Omnitrophota bacterium]